jgi:proline iminopeptidase
MAEMKSFYPEIEPFQSFMLETGSQHAIYVEICGNPDGIPVVFLHGGPCSGCKPDHRRFFNPQLYRIVIFDQRGCGRSLPFGEVEGNTTQDLIDDMEHIRSHLGLAKWLVFGGSWGAALGLLYAQQHADKVLGLVVRGVFLARQQDMAWFAGNGVNRIYPQAWEQLAGVSNTQSADALIENWWQAINHNDTEVAYRVACAWQAWNAQVAVGTAFPQNGQDIDEATKLAAIQQVRMELHYALRGYFIEDNQILANCHLIRHLSSIIIHGQYDLVCPLESALSLHRALPSSEFIVLPNAGHIAQHEEMIDALVSATDRFAVELTS